MDKTTKLTRMREAFILYIYLLSTHLFYFIHIIFIIIKLFLYLIQLMMAIILNNYY
jgi:hypothetical protein